MRYTEQLKQSWYYQWGIAQECWGMLVGRGRLWIVGLLVFLCLVPMIIDEFAIGTSLYLTWFTTTLAPTFELNLSQELATTDYYGKLRDDIPLLLVFNYFWVNGGGFRLLAQVLCWASLGVLAVAYLREETH